MKNKIFLHICCAPCSIEVIDSLISEDFEIFGYFYNPNIHPFDEYEKRRESVENHLKKLKIEYKIADYDMFEYFNKISGEFVGAGRCNLCYDLRLGKSAIEAKSLGFEKYSSTLLWNPHKDFNSIAETGRKNGEKYGVEFYFPKLTHDYWKYKAKAKEEELYIQKYCGCVFSSWENKQRSANS